MAELICPKSGEVCKSANFCNTLKSSPERAFGLKLFGFREIEKTLVEAGFCADKRISAMTELGSKQEISGFTLVLVESIAQLTIRSKNAPPSDCKIAQNTED